MALKVFDIFSRTGGKKVSIEGVELKCHCKGTIDDNKIDYKDFELSLMKDKVISNDPSVTPQVGFISNFIEVKGPKGINHLSSEGFALYFDGSNVYFRPLCEDYSKKRKMRESIAKLKEDYGTITRLLANAVKGVKEEFKKELELSGIGWKAELKPPFVSLKVGKSHTDQLLLEADVKLQGPTKLVVSSFNKERCGNFSAKIEGVRKHNPYTDSGVKIVGTKYSKKEVKK